MWDKFMSNIDGMAKGNPQLKELVVIEKWPDGLPKILYERIYLGMMFSERELCLYFKRDKNPDGSMTFHV
jgi:hypothetical protein